MAREKCSRCGGVLVAGYIPDRSHAAVFTANWVEGEWVDEPEKSFWFGRKLPKKGKEAHALQALRCSSCSFIELYAP